MDLPFTTQQFFDVFRAYNLAVWPAQWLLYGVGAAALGGAVLGRRDGRLTSAMLALLWMWMGIAYHWTFFTDINPLAWVFGALFVTQAALFAVEGSVRRRLHFAWEGPWRTVAGIVLLTYSLLVYPLLNAVGAHPYPESPTFGLPCPTTIFTIGVMCFAQRPFPPYILLVPILWSVVGCSSAVYLDMPQDLALLPAGLVAVLLAATSRARSGGGEAA